jgi:pimeloyl-ACP methyl ester carboxylesterase
VHSRLEPHENHYTSVVLLGHSMGGILSAEVALQPPSSPATGKPFMHQILGTINFDTPFLGMHPGVVVSGIGSLFRPAPEPPGARKPSASGTNTPSMDSQASVSSPSDAPSVVDSEFSSALSPTQSSGSPSATSSPNDPFFNPPFPNDVRLPERKGWNNLLHFITKHSDGLTLATKQYFMSHLEFGGCLADYPGLKNRYEKIRSLEDVDELARRDGPGYRPPMRRVRFTNYYTASTGRPKAPKSPKIPESPMFDADGNVKPIEVEMQDMRLEADTGGCAGSHTPTPTPSISIEEPRDGAITPQQLEGPDTSAVAEQMKNLGEDSGVQNDVQEEEPEMEMRHIDSMPMEDDEELDGLPLASTETTAGTDDEPVSEVKTTASEPPLPPVPAMPTEPDPIDLSVYTDKDARKIAEKEQKRVMKVYQQAVKDRESAIKDRQKLVEKRERKVRQERGKQLKAEEKQRQKEEREAEKQRLKEEKEEEKRKATINPEPRERQASVTSSVKDDKPKRDKKFCMLPPEYGGKRDKCWVRVYMEGVDEVGAHCGLFFPGPQYESLVGDVGARIEKWVQEDAAKRAALEAREIR